MSLTLVNVSAITEQYQNKTTAIKLHSFQHKQNFTEQTNPEVKTLQRTLNTTNNVPYQNIIVENKSIKSANLLNRPIKVLNMNDHAISEDLPKPQEQKSHAKTNKNTYLLEHDVASSVNAGKTADEQPIYGTWRTKARRPQPPNIVAPVSVAASMTSLSGGGNPDLLEKQHFQNKHLYERLPRRMSTMLPMRADLPEQIPRPPRLTSHRPSFLVRRQYLDTPRNGSSMTDIKPKPFHFPYDGPMPEKFKMAEADHSEVNNIQDILQHLHLNGAQAAVPPMMMMPTGLHIAGSFKNLKSSGVHNFFRGKRNKKHIQHMIPIPMSLPFYGAHSSNMYTPIPTSHQRISMEQFYALKPRSPHDINLLAMQQQLKTNRLKNKKKSKKMLLNNNILLQHNNNQLPYAIEPYASIYPQLIAVNVTEKSKLKRVPFKVNLDIFPVIPPIRDGKPATYSLDETRLVPSSRPPSALRHPYGDYDSYSINPSSPPALVYNGQFETPGFMPYKYSTSTPQHHQHSYPHPQSSNMYLSYQHHQQQQQPHKHQEQKQKPQSHKQQYLVNPQSLYPPHECVNPASSNINAQTQHKINPIMVHLNVFPKSSKSSTALSTPSPSTNPFYSAAGLNIHRNTMYEESDPHFHNSAQNRSYEELQRPQARKDDNINKNKSLIDFEHPIVAADVNRPEETDNGIETNRNVQQYNNLERQHFYNNYNITRNMDQAVNESRTASLFRFPVENLIQFHVDDAL